MPNQEMTKTAMNKSLIAVKEQGAMFECPALDERDTKKNKISYWVVGYVQKNKPKVSIIMAYFELTLFFRRLIFTPHVREMYVCYNDMIPQNILELAFKLNLGFGE